MPQTLTLSQRQELAHAHAKVIDELLSRPKVKTIPQRIFRTRLWVEMTPADIISEARHEYLVVSMFQNTVQPVVKVYVRRPYTQAVGGTSLIMMEMKGDYSADEIVAFLMLDTVPVEQVEWRDETASGLLTTADVLGSLQG